MFIARDAQMRLELRCLAAASAEENTDLHVAVELQRPNFSARNRSVWIAVATRDRFLSALSAVERARRGEALLESMNPNDLKCIVRVYDHAGHVELSGFVGDTLVDSDYPEIARVPFRIEIDPSAVSDLVRDLTATLRSVFE